MLRDLQKNRDGQFNDIRKTIKEQSEKFYKDIENIKKSQMEILELKNTMTELKNSTITSKEDLNKQKKESVSQKTDKLKLNNQGRKKKKRVKRNEESLWDLWDTDKKNHICVTISFSRRKRQKEAESLLKEIMFENFSSLGRDLDTQVCEVIGTHNFNLNHLLQDT